MTFVRSKLVLSSIVLSVAFSVSLSQAQTRFSVVLNEGNFGDAQESIIFYDADDLGSGPLFSVFTGFEASGNRDEPNAIDVDPDTGDVYFVTFDSIGGVSSSPGDLDAGSAVGGNPGPPGDDSEGDYDLFRINFSTVFNHWKDNFQGKDVRNLQAPNPMVDPFSPAPTAGFPSSGSNLDYVTYGVQSPAHSSFNFEASHSNTFVLPGSIEKIGEVKRNLGDSTDFAVLSLEFINQDTLLLIDDSKEDSGGVELAANDHSYRILERVSDQPNMANDASGDHLDGGFNRGTSESWNSRDLGPVNLDFVSGVATGHSEIESSAFHHDTATGVRGVWVTESDGGGDDVAFLEIDANGNSLGYRPHSTTGNPTSFSLDNNPFVDATTNDGKADNIFVDADTGDLIIIESGFGDSTDGSVPAVDHEPSVIRREVITYDNGSGQIQFGAWSERVILDPNTNATSGDTGNLERGQWAAYDSENDLLFFWNPGSFPPENPAFGVDVWVLDINTGNTTAFLDVDDSYNLFFGDAFGDKTDFFSLAGPGELGDFDGDGDTDGADFLEWQRRFPTLDADDLNDWENTYGNPLSAAGTVPEPTSLGLFGLSLAMISFRRTRRG